MPSQVTGRADGVQPTLRALVDAEQRGVLHGSRVVVVTAGGCVGVDGTSPSQTTATAIPRSVGDGYDDAIRYAARSRQVCGWAEWFGPQPHRASATTATRAAFTIPFRTGRGAAPTSTAPRCGTPSPTCTASTTRRRAARRRGTAHRSWSPRT